MTDQQDYARFLLEVGVTEDLVRALSENVSDQMPMPYNYGHLTVAPSKIDGRGLFTSIQIPCGAVVAPAQIIGKRTPAGRFINHSSDPNSSMERTKGAINVIALRDIGAGEEVTVSYRQVHSVFEQVAA